MAARDEVRRVVFEFAGDAGDLASEADDAARSLDSAGSSADKTANTFTTKLKPAAAAAGAAAAGMAAKWAVEGIGMAQTAEVAAESFDKVFGSAADDFLARNEDMRVAMGLSEAEFQKQVTAIGAVGISLHQTEEEAAQFAEDMVTVAADVAAFNGDIGSAPHVIEAMNSALIGNTESLEAYGIEVTAAMVSQRAMADSGKALESELTQLEKREATMALITEQSALMTGSLAEQMDSAAVKSNQFAARMADVQTEVGAALLPLKELVLEVLLAMVPILEALNPLITQLATLISALTRVLTPVIQALGKVFEFLIKITSAVRELTGPVNVLIKVFNRLSKAIKDAFSWTPPQWMQSMGIQGFHSGGVVPGPIGSEQLIRAQGGERIVPAGAGSQMGGQGGGGGGTVVNINVEAGLSNPDETARRIVDLLENYTSVNGAVDIRTTGGA